MEDYLLSQLEADSVHHEEVMVDKQVLEINDINNGGYNGTINFNLSAWSNNDLMIDYSNAYIQIPVILKCEQVSRDDGASPPVAAATFGATASAFACGIKNCYANFIDSITVSYNGKNVVEQQAFTNFHVNFRLLTGMSEDDVNKWGPSIGFYKDDVNGYQYAGGLYTNNVDDDNVEITDRNRNGVVNSGFTKRKQLTTAYQSTKQLPHINSDDGLYGMNNFTIDGYFAYWAMIVTIRLKDISDFFNRAGLLRNANINISITYNQVDTTINATDAATSVYTNLRVNPKSGNTNPILITSGGSACVKNNFFKFTSDYIFTTKIGVDGNYSVKSLSNSSRLYACGYTPSNKTNELIMTRYPTRKIVYNDIYTYKINNKTGAFNEIVSNGITGLQYLVVIPVANEVIPPYQSPFDTCPGTSTPLATIDNFQVQIGGKNIFQKNFQYTYETFLFELSSINAKNGGALTGSTSGLISQHDFNFGYRYYVCDLSRRASYENNKPQSVAVLGTNVAKTGGTPVAMDYIVIIAYQKNLSIDTITGQVVA